MPWTPPSDPVTSTVITVAYAVANLLTQIRWLRLLTGNADPPGTGYVVTSDSAASTSWKSGQNALTAVLGYRPVATTGDMMTNTLRIFRTQGPVTGAYDTAPLVIQTPDALSNPSETAGIGLNRSNSSGVYLHHAGAAAANLLRLIAANGTVGTVWSSLNQGLNSGLDADTLRTLTPGNESGQVPISNGRPNAGLVAANSAALQGFVPGNASGMVPISNGTENVNLVAASATNATTAGGVPVSTTPSANRIPVSDAGGKLDAWITPGATGAFVPSGLIALWRNSDTVPDAGWVFDTNFRDKFVVGAGLAYARDQTGGTLTHDHGFGGSHTGGSVANDASAPIRVQVSGTGTDPQASPSGHGHVFTQPSAHGVTNASLNHLPPYIAVHHIRKI